MIISYNVEVVKNYDVNIPKLIDQVVKTLKEDEEGEVEGWMILNEAGEITQIIICGTQAFLTLIV